MEYNSFSMILDEFDFTDSIIVDIAEKNFLTELSLLIDYYWDIQEGKNETRILKLSFMGCTKIIYSISKDIVKEIELGHNVDSFFTIVRLERTSEKSIAIYNGISELPIIKIEFESVILSEKNQLQ